MSKEGVRALKTQQATISKEDAYAILEAMASLDLETKEVEENGWQLRMYKNVGGKNRLVKTIVHDEKNPKGFNEWIRLYYLLSICLCLEVPIIHGKNNVKIYILT